MYLFYSSSCFLLPSFQIFSVPVSNSLFQVDSWEWESERERQEKNPGQFLCGLAALSVLHMQWDLSFVSWAFTQLCKPGHILTTEWVKDKKETFK